MLLFVIGLIAGVVLTILAISLMIWLTKDYVYDDMLADLEAERIAKMRDQA